MALNTGGVTNAAFAMALCWQMFYCGPLSRAIFRLLFRRGEKQGTAILNLYYNYIRAVSQPRWGAASQPVCLYKFNIPDIQIVNNVPILPRF